MSNGMESLARSVLSSYDIKPDAIKVIQSGGIKTVWKIGAANTNYCLKRLKQTPDKALFTINAQDYMSRRGAKVPAIRKASNGKLYTIFEDELFVLYDWITGSQLNMNVKSHLAGAVRGIAEFHRDSAGFIPPEGCRVSSKLGRWPHHYESMIARFKEWKENAQESPAQALSKVFLTHVDDFIGKGEQAMELLRTSGYDEIIKNTEKRKTLCHQDYGEGNALLTEKGVYVIDLDGVTYDLPVRDLRKIINKRMANAGDWKLETLSSIVNWYYEVNPLSAGLLRLLYIDLMFPHEFHDTAKNPYRKNKIIGSDKLSKAAKLEQSKERVLAAVRW
jgi:spore coat protein I